jgi:hypothetical protein
MSVCSTSASPPECQQQKPGVFVHATHEHMKRKKETRYKKEGIDLKL